MKTLKFLLAITIAMITLLACESPMESSMLDDANYVLAPTLSREEAALVLYDYLVTDGTSVSFDLTLADALKLGVTESLYEEFLSCVKDINVFAEERISEQKDLKIKLLDVDSKNSGFTYESYNDMALSNTRSIPAKRVDLNGQYWNSTDTFFLPMEFNSFDCHCQAAAALAAAFHVETNFLAPWPHMWVAPLTTIVKEVARVYGSNIYGYVRCRTTDSNGGFVGLSAARYEFDSDPNDNN